MGGHANASMLAALAQGDTRHSPRAPFQRRAHNGGGAVAGSAAESAAPPVLDHGAAGSIQSHLLRLQLLRMVAPRVDARPLAQPLSLPLDVHGARARTPASRLTAALPVSSPSLPSLPPMSLWAARNAAPVSRALGTPLASPAASNVLSHVTMATATGAPGVPAVAALQRPVTAVVTSAAAATSAVAGPAAMSTALHAARVPPAPATSPRMAAAATHGAGVRTSHPAVDTGPAVAAVDPSAVHLQGLRAAAKLAADAARRSAWTEVLLAAQAAAARRRSLAALAAGAAPANRATGGARAGAAAGAKAAPRSGAAKRRPPPSSAAAAPTTATAGTASHPTAAGKRKKSRARDTQSQGDKPRPAAAKRRRTASRVVNTEAVGGTGHEAGGAAGGEPRGAADSACAAGDGGPPLPVRLRGFRPLHLVWADFAQQKLPSVGKRASGTTSCPFCAASLKMSTIKSHMTSEHPGMGGLGTYRGV